MQKYKKNIFIQCLFFTFLWQFLLTTLYLTNLITYNPLIELSDIIPNFFFIYLISLFSSSPLFGLILLFLIYIFGVLLYFFIRQNLTLAQIANIPELISVYAPISFFL